MLCFLQNAPIIFRSFQTGVSCVPQPTDHEMLSTHPGSPWRSIATALLTLRCQHPSRGSTSQIFPRCQSARQRWENLLLRISKSCQEKILTSSLHLSSSMYLDSDQEAAWAIQQTSLYWFQSWGCNNEHRDLVPAFICVLLFPLVCP